MPLAARNRLHSYRFGRPSTGAERAAVARKLVKASQGAVGSAAERGSAANRRLRVPEASPAIKVLRAQSLRSGNTLARTCENDGGLPKHAALDGWGAPADRPELCFAGGSPPRGKTPRRQPSRPGAR